jgi:hypothetical protein
MTPYLMWTYSILSTPQLELPTWDHLSFHLVIYTASPPVIMVFIIKYDIYNCGNKCGFKLAKNEKRSGALGHTWRLVCNRGMIYREPSPEGKSKLKVKYEGGELYEERIDKTTEKQSHRVESTGR